jgi:SAM-dependent methyltransferase
VSIICPPDRDRTSWGNHLSNVEFLGRTGLLASHRKVLEIGCGMGLILSWLAEHGHDAIGIDMNPAAVAACKDDLTVLEANGEDLPFEDESFEIVMSFDVLEHIPDTDRHLLEVRRVLRPGGWYLFQTPNKWTNIPFEILRWSKRYGIRRAFDFLKPPQHCSLHNYWQLRRRLHKHGFAVEYYDVPVVNEYFKNKVKKFAGNAGLVALQILNPDRLPVALRTNFYVSARMLAG